MQSCTILLIWRSVQFINLFDTSRFLITWFMYIRSFLTRLNRSAHSAMYLLQRVRVYDTYELNISYPAISFSTRRAISFQILEPLAFTSYSMKNKFGDTNTAEEWTFQRKYIFENIQITVTSFLATFSELCFISIILVRHVLKTFSKCFLSKPN